MLKLLFYTFILSKSYIVMKCSIKLVAYWLIFFGDRTCKYRHDNYQAIFHIFRLISNFPLKQLSSSHSHKKDVIIKFENNFFFQKNRQLHADIVVSLSYLWDSLLFVVVGAESKIKNQSYFKTLYIEKGNEQSLS